MASCTLDASVKIYSCRVDSIHSEAYKVLGGIGGSEMIPEEAEDGEGGTPSGEGGEGTEEGKGKMKKRVSGGWGLGDCPLCPKPIFA
jgi:condensin complex subunit 2